MALESPVSDQLAPLLLGCAKWHHIQGCDEVQGRPPQPGLEERGGARAHRLLTAPREQLQEDAASLLSPSQPILSPNARLVINPVHLLTLPDAPACSGWP